MRYRRIGALALGGLAFLGASCTSVRRDPVVNEQKPAPLLSCALQAHARVRSGDPVRVHFRLKNLAARPLFVLGWRTPIEGLFGNDWQVTRGGVEIPYQGPMVKRGEPEAEDYVTIAPGEAAEAEVEVSLAYEMRQPGRYVIAFRGPLMDVTTATAAVPRPLAQHQPMAVQCAVLEIEVTP